MSIYEEVEIEDMEWEEEEQQYTYPCPCGDKFVISLVRLCWDGLVVVVHGLLHPCLSVTRDVSAKSTPTSLCNTHTNTTNNNRRPSYGTGRTWRPAPAARSASV